jgi:hypothetical protein
MACGVAAAGAAVAVANCEPLQTYNLELSYEELKGIASRFEFQRSVENALAATVGGGLVIGDMFLLTGTGVVGLTVGCCLCATYVWFHLEPVPISGNGKKPRQRFIDTSPQMMMLLGLMEYHVVKNSNTTFPADHAHSKMCTQVGNLLAGASGLKLPAGQHWEFTVIDDDQVNAFVLPNCGKVFVHRGLIDLLKTPEGLAVILSHEIAHAQVKSVPHTVPCATQLRQYSQYSTSMHKFH